MRPGTFNVAIGLNADLSQSCTAVAYEALSLEQGEHAAGKDFQLIPGALITGKVLDANTQKPLAGLSIGVYGPAHPKSGAWVQTCRSGADGSYQLRVPPGDQYVYFQDLPPEGYLEPKVKSQNVTVTVDQPTTVDFLLPPNPNPPIAGRVVDDQGKPVAGATVTLDAPIAEMAFGQGLTKTTDEQGHFRFAAATPESTLRARKGKIGLLEPLKVNGGEQNITLVLKDGYVTSITGLVTDAQGQPIANASVVLITRRGDTGLGGEPHRTDANGRYSFDDLTVDAQYSIDAVIKGYGQASENVPLKPGVSTEAAPLKLAKADSFIAGQVIDAAGHPVAGAKVGLMIDIGTPPETLTDATGHFRFDGLVAGKMVTVYTIERPAFVQAKAGTADVVLKLPAPK
jgi:hypothetical protein